MSRVAIRILSAAGLALAAGAPVTPAAACAGAAGGAEARCSCVGKPPSVGRTVRAADFVAIATLDSAFRDPADSTLETVVYRLRVERAWRWPDTTSTAPPPLVAVHQRDNTTCREGIAPGDRYLVVAHRRGPTGALHLGNRCGSLAGPIDTLGRFGSILRTAASQDDARRWARERAEVMDSLRRGFGPGTMPAR